MLDMKYKVALLREQIGGSRYAVRFMLVLLSLFVIWGAVLTGSSHAAGLNKEPYLDLSGIILEINRATGYVYIDVSSEQCPGRNAFRADDIEKLRDYMGKHIFFIIDSKHCTGMGSETILVSRGVRK